MAVNPLCPYCFKNEDNCDCGEPITITMSHKDAQLIFSLSADIEHDAEYGKTYLVNSDEMEAICRIAKEINDITKWEK